MQLIENIAMVFMAVSSKSRFQSRFRAYVFKESFVTGGPETLFSRRAKRCNITNANDPGDLGRPAAE